MSIGTLLVLPLILAAALQGGTSASAAPTATQTAASGPPADYVIGVADLLGVVFVREQDRALSTEAVVRPDGKITVPMLNDIQAAGLTPEQLGTAVQKAAAKYIRDPRVTVIVREIRSRRVFVIGQVVKPGTILLNGEMNVLQVLAEAGGFLEDADKEDIAIVRVERGQERRYKFNYNEVVRGRNTDQNIRMLPGDTILVR
jgi:polysaccharide export outer membrane protein